jgi:hypothetical protein
MAAIDDLRAWFEHDIRSSTWDENVKVDDSDPSRVDIRFYTETNEYQLIIFTEGDERAPYVNIEGFVRARKPRAGQTSPRVRRLLRTGLNQPNQRTWRRILGTIVGLELVRVHRDRARVAAPDRRAEDVSEEVGPDAADC